MQKVLTAAESSPSLTAQESEFMEKAVCIRDFAKVVRVSVAACLKSLERQKSVKSSAAARNSVTIIALLHQPKCLSRMTTLKIATG